MKISLEVLTQCASRHTKAAGGDLRPILNLFSRSWPSNHMGCWSNSQQPRQFQKEQYMNSQLRYIHTLLLSPFTWSVLTELIQLVVPCKPWSHMAKGQEAIHFPSFSALQGISLSLFWLQNHSISYIAWNSGMCLHIHTWNFLAVQTTKNVLKLA